MSHLDDSFAVPIAADTELMPRNPARSGIWRRRLGTFALVLLGLVVFEVTASPSLGVAIACLKFGWDDARDGAWLRLVDPNRQRGRACSWIYLGVGFYKASLIAFLGAVVMAIFAFYFGTRLGWPRHLLAAQLFGALAVGLLGVTLATLASLVAIFIAWRGRVKLWVGPEARRARDRGEWPPRAEHGGIARRNRIGSLPLLAITNGAVFGFSVAVGSILAAFPILRQALRQPEPTSALVIIFVVSIAFAIFLLTLRDLLQTRVIASRPEECWPVAFENIDRFPIASLEELE